MEKMEKSLSKILAQDLSNQGISSTMAISLSDEEVMARVLVAVEKRNQIEEYASDKGRKLYLRIPVCNRYLLAAMRGEKLDCAEEKECVCWAQDCMIQETIEYPLLVPEKQKPSARAQ